MTQQNFTKIIVSDWLQSHPQQPVLISQFAVTSDIAKTLIANHSRDAYIVDENKKLLGYLSLSKVASHVLSEHRPIHSHREIFARITESTAKDLMDPHFAYARDDESLCDVIHRQLERDIDTLVVLSNEDKLLGAIKLSELVEESLK